MRATLSVTTPPDGEPVTVAMVKLHCRIDNEADDDLLAGYLITARVLAEDYLSRKLLTQTVLWTMRPSAMNHAEQSKLTGPLQLPRSPVQSIESVTALDVWGNVTAIPAATLALVPPAEILGYVADLALEPATLLIGRETLLTGGYPVHATELLHLQVSMVVGYDDASTVPPTINQAIMMTTAYLYEHRGDTDAAMPMFAERLLDRDRLQFLGG